MINYEPGYGWTFILEDLDGSAHRADLPHGSTIEMNLPGGALTLDSLGAPRISAVYLAEQDELGTVDQTAAPWLRALFGVDPQQLTASTSNPAQRPDAAAIVARLADAEHLRAAGSSPQLAALLLGEALTKLGLPEQAGVEFAAAAAAIAALARYLDARPRFLDRLGPVDRADLERLVEAALRSPSVTSKTWLRESYEKFRAALATPDLITKLEQLLQREVAYAGLADKDQVADEVSARVVDVTSTWLPTDFTALGEAAQEFFAGVHLRGTWPGAATASFPLKSGADRRLGNLVGRIYTWQGRLLGEAPVNLAATSGLPRGSFSISLGKTAEGDTAQGVLLQLATAGSRLLHSVELPRLAQRRALQLARVSLELRTNGDLEAAEEAWRGASALATLVTGQSPDEPGDQRRPGDCLRSLGAVWCSDASEVIEDAKHQQPGDRANSLLPVIRDLGRALATSGEVARAYEHYADAISTDPELADDAQDYLLTALRLFYAVRDPQGATRVLRKIKDHDADHQQ